MAQVSSFASDTFILILFGSISILWEGDDFGI